MGKVEWRIDPEVLLGLVVDDGVNKQRVSKLKDDIKAILDEIYNLNRDIHSENPNVEALRERLTTLSEQVGGFAGKLDVTAQGVAKMKERLGLG